MKVLKFGGSSLADSNRISSAAKIISTSDKNKFIVLSAMKGFTNSLISAAEKAEAGDESYKSDVVEIESRTLAVISELWEQNPLDLIDTIETYLTELKEILQGISLVRECSARSKDLLSGFGERLNCTVVAAYLNSINVKAHYIDAREIIKTDDRHGSAIVNLEKSYNLINDKLSKLDGKLIITGFIASTDDGISTTLGRNGSDYTATIVARAMNVESCEIWTDVDGVLTADPRIVENAKVIDQLSLEEAFELSFFGAEVIHPSTLSPVAEKEIPVWIKNSKSPEVIGTMICGKCGSNRPVTGIASIDKVSLINIEGKGMVGMSGCASSIFSSLADSGINIIMITQASSEHSISVLCREEEADIAVNSLKEDLSELIQQRVISNIDVVSNLEIVAVVGANMKGQIGLCGRIFSTLGDNKINILAIAQGSSEKNISFVIDGKDTKLALNSLHKEFLE